MPPLSSKDLRVGPFSYGLAQECLESTEYESWMFDLARSSHLILDNGADELGQSLDPDIYHSLIRQILPYEIILPDKLQNSEFTISEGKKFLEGGFPDTVSVMAVAQGETWEEWSECYDVWYHNPRVSVIGIVYDIDFDLPWVPSSNGLYHRNREEKRAHNRVAVIKKLSDENRLDRKTIHLLGFNNLWETWSLRSVGIIRTIDTRGPFSAGLAGVKWNSNVFGKMWSTPDQSKVSREDVKASLEEINFNVVQLLLSSGDEINLLKWQELVSNV